MRLVISECDKFPEIAATFYEIAVVQTSKAIAKWLERQWLKLENPVVAASALRGMVIMDPQRAAMLGIRNAPSPKEIKVRARFCAGLFLHGCQVK